MNDSFKSKLTKILGRKSKNDGPDTQLPPQYDEVYSSIPGSSKVFGQEHIPATPSAPPLELADNPTATSSELQISSDTSTTNPLFEESKEEEEKRRATEEQVRLDMALAQRLIQEDIYESFRNPSTSIGYQIPPNPTSKYNVSTYKYEQLRNVINTSQDIEHIRACREEFHRRLRIYNQFKERNASARDGTPQKSPHASHNSVAPRAVSHGNPSAQRYFMFFKTFDVLLNPDGYLQFSENNVVWYAHFNGQWVQREIELHPGKEPLLMTAESDSLRMCRKSVDQLEQDLIRLKGAEITETKFESIWELCGGRKRTHWTPDKCTVGDGLSRDSEGKEKDVKSKPPLPVKPKNLNAAKPPPATPQRNQSLQRFFKIPFNSVLRVQEESNGTLQTNGMIGFWYGHFFGQSIRRQIELHPGKSPILLKAENDKHRMYSKTLNQLICSKLNQIEITEKEFQMVWDRFDEETEESSPIKL